MDKFDFINWLISLYPHAIKDSKAQYDLYDRVLNKNKIDFDKLADIFSNEYSDSFPPPGAVLKEFASRCIKEDVIQADKWIHVKMKTPPDFGKKYGNGGNIDVFPSGWSDEKIVNYYQKRFDGEGWKILEVR